MFVPIAVFPPTWKHRKVVTSHNFNSIQNISVIILIGYSLAYMPIRVSAEKAQRTDLNLCR